MTLWTDPRTWVDTEVEATSTLNTHIRDQFKAIGDPRTLFGDASSWTASGSAPDLGSGVWAGRYAQYGKHVEGTIRLKFAGDTTFGTGTWLFELPVAAYLAATPSRLPIGVAFVNDASAGQQTGVVTLFDSTTCRVAVDGGGNVTPSNPWTWANNDELYLTFQYEAA